MELGIIWEKKLEQPVIAQVVMEMGFVKEKQTVININCSKHERRKK